MARIIGFWARIGNKLVPVVDDFDGLILPPEGSILFEDGSYGIRVSGGTLQFKNKNGSWQNFGTGGGGGDLDYNNFSAVAPIIYDGAGEFSLSVPAQASLAKADTAIQPADLKTVATSGDYSDLTNKPTLGSLAAKNNVLVSDINATGIGSTKYLKGDGTWDTPSGGGGSSLFLNVKDYGAVGDNSTDDTTSIQNAIDTASVKGGVVWFPAGRYKITSALKLYSGSTPNIVGYSNITLAGEGSSVDGVKGSIISQTTTGADIIKGLNDGANGAQSMNVNIKDLHLTFGGATKTNSGNGIYLAQQSAGSPAFYQYNITNVTVTACQGSGKYGMNFESLIVSSIVDCHVLNSANGFLMNGSPNGNWSAVSTSTTFINCYANMATNGVTGFKIRNATYVSLLGCAVDYGGNSSGSAYLIDTSNSVNINNCGFELEGSNTLTYGFNITGSHQVGILNSYFYQSKSTKEILVTGNSSGVTLIGNQSNSSVSGSTGLQVDSGSQATVIDCNFNSVATPQTISGTLKTITDGTVTSVSGTGTVSGLSLSGTVNTSGNLTLGGSISGLTTSNLSGSAGITNAQLAGSIANAKLSNSSITIAGSATALGGSITRDTITGVSSNGFVKRTGTNTFSAVAKIGVSDINATGIGSTKYLKGDGTWDTVIGINNTPSLNSATLAGTTILPVVTNPSGSPASEKVSFTDLITWLKKNPRVSTTTTTATLTPNLNTADSFYLTAQSGALTIATPTNMVAGTTINIIVKDNGTARALTINSDYKFATGNTKPTDTIVGEKLEFVVHYDGINYLTRWSSYKV